MAYYTDNLVAGEILMCKTIRSGTVKPYLSVAAELSRPVSMMNPYLDIMGNQSRYISDIIKRIKKVGNRNQP